MQWERILEWLADSSQSEQEHPHQLSAQSTWSLAVLNWEPGSLPARAFQPGLNSKTVPKPDKGVLKTYLVAPKALSGIWEIVIQIPVPEWSEECIGHRKWEWSKSSEEPTPATQEIQTRVRAPRNEAADPKGPHSKKSATCVDVLWILSSVMLT